MERSGAYVPDGVVPRAEKKIFRKVPS
jgi:hypothetical protein